MPPSSTYPADLHQVAVETIAEGYCRHPAVLAVLLVNSCTRGLGTPASDLDLAVFTVPHLTAVQQATLECSWRELYPGSDALRRLRASGPLAGVHPDFFDGSDKPGIWDDGGGPDSFELAIGNQVVYNKWIREQIAGWLELPGRYREPTSLLEIDRLERHELIGKGDHLGKLVQQWAAF